MIYEGWEFMPRNDTDAHQVNAPIIGGYDDGNEVDIGSCDDLPDHLQIPGDQHWHHYALERRGDAWVYVFVLSEEMPQL